MSLLSNGGFNLKKIANNGLDIYIVKKKSTIDVSEKEAQKIIYKNAGTGELLRVNGLWTKKEFISEEKEFGTYKSLDGVNTKTNNGIITYKNNGQCHLIPSRPKRK